METRKDKDVPTVPSLATPGGAQSIRTSLAPDLSSVGPAFAGRGPKVSEEFLQMQC